MLKKLHLKGSKQERLSPGFRHTFGSIMCQVPGILPSCGKRMLKTLYETASSLKSTCAGVGGTHWPKVPIHGLSPFDSIREAIPGKQADLSYVALPSSVHGIKKVSLTSCPISVLLGVLAHLSNGCSMWGWPPGLTSSSQSRLRRMCPQNAWQLCWT